MSIDLDTRLELVKLYYGSGQSAIATLRAYKAKHKMKHDPFSATSISPLISKFEETKSLHDAPKSGRPSLREERKPAVQASLQSVSSSNSDGYTSIPAVARYSGIPPASVQRILRQHIGMYPYHPTTVQEIKESDKQVHLEFSNWLLQCQSLWHNIIWSNEAYFSIDGTVNKHNCTI